MNKWRALKVACGILVAVLAFRVFYFQELFFAFLLFTTAYLLLLLLVAVVLCLLYAYVRGVTYVAARASVQGRRTLPLLRVLVLWLAPTVTTTAHVLLVCQRLLSYPFQGLMQGWLRSFRFDAVQLRQDAERALKDLRLRVKQS